MTIAQLDAIARRCLSACRELVAAARGDLAGAYVAITSPRRRAHVTTTTRRYPR